MSNTDSTSGRQTARNVARCLEQMLLPPVCVVCRNSGMGDIDLCEACVACLPKLVAETPPAHDATCLGCGRTRACTGTTGPYRDVAGRPWCEACRHRSSPFRRVVAPWRYAYPVDGLIGSFKHHGQRPVGRSLGRLLAQEVRRVAAGDEMSPSLPEVIIPVPDHPARLAERRFSPTADIARAAALSLGVPLLASAAVRIVDTGALARRSRAERALAIKGAFQVHGSLHRRHVALVDDVLTTGATSTELARECLDTGVASVELWVLARTAIDH